MAYIAEQLHRYKLIDTEITAKIQELNKLRKIKEAAPTPAAVQKCAMLEKDIDKSIDTLADLKKTIETKIEALDDDTQRLLLKLIYINGYTTEEAAEELHYSVQHTFRIKKKALKHFQGER